MTDQQTQQTFAVGDRVRYQRPERDGSAVMTGIVVRPPDSGEGDLSRTTVLYDNHDEVALPPTHAVTLVAKALYLDDEDVAALGDVADAAESDLDRTDMSDAVDEEADQRAAIARVRALAARAGAR